MVTTQIINMDPYLLVKNLQNLALKIQFTTQAFEASALSTGMVQASLLRACMSFFIHAPTFGFATLNFFCQKRTCMSSHFRQKVKIFNIYHI